VKIIQVSNFPDAMAIIERCQREGHSDVLLTSLSAEELLHRQACCEALIMDFDDTTTRNNQWPAIEELFADPARREHLDLLRAFNCRPDGSQAVWYRQIPPEEDVDHARELFECIDHAQWSLDPIAITLSGKHVTELAHLACSEHFQIRPGTLALHKLFAHRAIVSMGVYDLIVMILGAHQFPEAQVAATQLRFNTEGRVCGVKPGTIITQATKRFASQAFLYSHHMEPSQALVLGDSPFDADLFLSDNNGKDGSVNGLIFDPSRPRHVMEAFLHSHLPQMWKDKLTFILFSEGYKGLVDLICKARS